MNISVQIARIRDAKGQRPGHVEYLKKDDMADVAGDVLEKHPEIHFAPQMLDALRLIVQAMNDDDGVNAALANAECVLHDVDL